jgi:hypothetical protein
VAGCEHVGSLLLRTKVHMRGIYPQPLWLKPLAGRVHTSGGAFWGESPPQRAIAAVGASSAGRGYPSVMIELNGWAWEPNTIFLCCNKNGVGLPFLDGHLNTYGPFWVHVPYGPMGHLGPIRPIGNMDPYRPIWPHVPIWVFSGSDHLFRRLK